MCSMSCCCCCSILLLIIHIVQQCVCLHICVRVNAWGEGETHIFFGCVYFYYVGRHRHSNVDRSSRENSMWLFIHMVVIRWNVGVSTNASIHVFALTTLYTCLSTYELTTHTHAHCWLHVSKHFRISPHTTRQLH